MEKLDIKRVGLIPVNCPHSEPNLSAPPGVNVTQSNQGSDFREDGQLAS